MSNKATVWVDVDLCTACAACVDVCKTGAITVVDGLADVDETGCSGCLACVDACPEGAIRPVVEGELVATDARSRPVVSETRSLASRAAPLAAVAGAHVLAQVARGLIRLVSHWVNARHETEHVDTRGRAPMVSTERANGRARRARHRRGRR
jgi:Fe-S-cluster-containing hydrogenase component 2